MLEDAKKWSCIKAHQSILQNPKAKRHRHIWRTDQNAPQTNHRKDLMSSERKNVRAIFAQRSIIQQKLQDKPIRGQISFETHFQILPNTATRQLQPKNPTQRLKKLLLVNDATKITNTMKWKKNCIPILSFISEQNLISRIKTSMHLKNLKLFSSLHRLETHFRHQQGHQQASGLAGSNNIFQGTNFTAHEVEHQKTVKTEKFGERTNWFSEVIKKIFHHAFGRARQEDAKTQEVKLDCIAKAHQSIIIDQKRNNWSILNETSCWNSWVLFGHFLSGKLDFWSFKELFRQKKQHVFPFTYNPMKLDNSAVLYLIHNALFQAVFKTKYYYCLTLFFQSRNVKNIIGDSSHLPIIFIESEDFLFEMH